MKIDLQAMRDSGFDVDVDSNNVLTIEDPKAETLNVGYMLKQLSQTNLRPSDIDEIINMYTQSVQEGCLLRTIAQFTERHINV